MTDVEEGPFVDLPVDPGTTRPPRTGYLLAMLSHGYPYSATAEETLRSLSQAIDRPPDFAVYYHDGPGVAFVAKEASEYQAVSGGAQIGFCGATRALWTQAARAATDRGISYVLWVEHDFRFLRPFRVRDLVLVLRDAQIAQVSLMREPTGREAKEGGVLRGAFVADDGYVVHSRYFTTNPSLMRTSFMRQNPFPDFDAECEGRFGLDLVDRGYRFAVAGDGVDAWVEHFGTRNGFGY